ncbi:MAG: TolC family protein [Bacteroidales bacterium]|nr:TolC family protein [Bacteroidales bacterium]
MNYHEDFTIADTVLLKLELSLSDSISLSQNPVLLSSKQQIEIMQLETKVEKSKMMPDLSIGYFSQSIIGTQEVNGQSLYFSASDRFTGVEAGITIPLWFYPHTSKIKAAKIRHQIAQTEASRKEQEIKADLSKLLGEYEMYKKSLSYYESLALPQAEMIIQQSVRSFQAGALDYMDYIQNLSRAIVIKIITSKH